MKKVISSVLACAALLSLSTLAAAETQKYDTDKFATYNVTASLLQKQITLDIIIPSKVDAAITTTFNVNTNEGFDINTSETGAGQIDSNLLAMDFYSPEYQIVNNSDIPIKVFTTLSATTKGKTVLFEDIEKDVEGDNKKNLRLWLSSSMSEGGSKAERDKTTNKRIFNSEATGKRNADILITKKAPSTAAVLFEKIGAKTTDETDTSNVGYFRINGQAKEIPNPYWDAKDGVNIKFVLKITPAEGDE